jgi:hypothetical protein
LLITRMPSDEKVLKMLGGLNHMYVGWKVNYDTFVDLLAELKATTGKRPK